MGIIVFINKHIISAINRIDSRLLIFLILCLNLLSFAVQSNEESYFALAKQYMDTDWIPDSFVFSEWVGTRFLFQTIAGFALKFLSFEQLAFWGRMVNFLCFSFPLALIFKELKMKNIGILFVFQLFMFNMNTQHFFGDEWIFRGFESKTMAYIFVFYALYYLLKNKYGRVALFAAFASYFHILVGGWFFVLAFVYVLINERNVKISLKTGFIYLGVVFPFIVYLGLYLNNDGSVINGVDIDWVYSFFRNPHHTAPMHRIRAMQSVLPRVAASFMLLLASIFYFRKHPDENIRKLNLVATISLCMIFIGLIITYIDVNGRILKYYLFRISAIGAFCYFLLLFLFLRDKLQKRFNSNHLQVILFIFILPFFLIGTVKNISRQIEYSKKEKDLKELVAFVCDNTNPDDIYLFLDKDEDTFSRRTRRDAFVVFKFVPGGGEKIYEWYIRVQERKKLQEDIAYIDTIKEKYRLDYLIARKEIKHSHLKKRYHDNKYYLYEVVQSE